MIKEMEEMRKDNETLRSMVKVYQVMELRAVIRLGKPGVNFINFFHVAIVFKLENNSNTCESFIKLTPAYVSVLIIDWNFNFIHAYHEEQKFFNLLEESTCDVFIGL